MPLVSRQRGGQLLTEPGARFHQRISFALQEIASASSELLMLRDALPLRIWCMPGFAVEWLTGRLPNFQALHPEIEVSLRPSDRSPDFATHEAEIDIHYLYGDERIEPSSISGVTRRFELARPAAFPVASPETVKTLGDFASPEDLIRARLLHEDTDLQWRSWFSAHEVTLPEHLPGTRLWHAHLALAAARQGQGIALANSYLVEDDLKTGRLVYALGAPDHGAVPLGIYVFSARADRWQSAAIADFRRWLRQEVSPEAPLAPANMGTALARYG